MKDENYSNIVYPPLSPKTWKQRSKKKICWSRHSDKQYQMKGKGYNKMSLPKKYILRPEIKILTTKPIFTGI